MWSTLNLGASVRLYIDLEWVNGLSTWNLVCRLTCTSAWEIEYPGTEVFGVTWHLLILGITDNTSETVQLRDIVATEDKQKIVCGLSNGVNTMTLCNTFLTLILREVYHVLATVYTWIGKRMRLVISTVFSKLKDFSRSQAVTYTDTVTVTVSRKRFKIETLLPQTTNRKWYMAHRIVAISMT